MSRSAVFGKAAKWGQPLKNILSDYVEVSKDVAKDARSYPLKYLTLGMFGCVITCVCRRCPNLKDYHSEIIEYSNEIGLCADTTRNSRSKGHVDDMSMLLADRYLQCINFGIFSVIIRRPSSAQCRNYHQVCAHLHPRVWTFHERVVDVGVWGQWLFLDKIMKDFDVNETEFKQHVLAKENIGI